MDRARTGSLFRKRDSYRGDTINNHILKRTLLGYTLGNKQFYKLDNDEIVIAAKEDLLCNFRYNAETASYYVLVPPGIFD